MPTEIHRIKKVLLAAYPFLKPNRQGGDAYTARFPIASQAGAVIQ